MKMGNRLMQLNAGGDFPDIKKCAYIRLPSFLCLNVHIQGEIKNDCGFARDNVKLYFDGKKGRLKSTWTQKKTVLPENHRINRWKKKKYIFAGHLHTIRFTGFIVSVYLLSLVPWETSDMFSGWWMSAVGTAENKINWEKKTSVDLGESEWKHQGWTTKLPLTLKSFQVTLITFRNKQDPIKFKRINQEMPIYLKNLNSERLSNTGKHTVVI